MKLPEDKKERTQILVLGALMACGALYGVYMAVNVHLLKPHKENLKKIESLTDKIKEADGFIELMPDLKKNSEQFANDIKVISDKYVLHPRLSSYVLPAKDFIMEQARKAKANVIDVKPIGIINLPDPPIEVSTEPEESGKRRPPPPRKQYAFKIFRARVIVDNGLHNMIRLIRTVEQANPFTCITEINITPDPKDPAKHDMYFDIDWPIWNKSPYTEQILEELDTYVGSDTSSETEKTEGKAPAEEVNAKADGDQAKMLEESGIELGVPGK